MRILAGNMDKIVQYENRGEMLGYFDKDSVGHGCFDGLTLTQPTIISAKFLLFCEKVARLDKALERYKKLYNDSNDLDAEEMLADMIRVMKGE